jgi:hypothetical protein
MEPLDDAAKEVVRVLDKMAEAGWIDRSAATNDLAAIRWTRSGESSLEILRGIMFMTLSLEPSDMKAFGFVVSESGRAGGLQDTTGDTAPPRRR